jgi:excisionase family DNA binding protein
MFIIEFTFKVGGTTVSLAAFIAALLAQVIQGVTTELAKQAPVVPQTTVQTMSPPSKAEPLVVSILEAARLLGLRHSTIWAMLFRRRIPSVRMGRRVLIPMEVIRKIVNEGIPPSSRR